MKLKTEWSESRTIWEWPKKQVTKLKVWWKKKWDKFKCPKLPTFTEEQQISLMLSWKGIFGGVTLGFGIWCIGLGIVYNGEFISNSIAYYMMGLGHFQWGLRLMIKYTIMKYKTYEN